MKFEVDVSITAHLDKMILILICIDLVNSYTQTILPSISPSLVANELRSLSNPIQSISVTSYKSKLPDSVSK